MELKDIYGLWDRFEASRATEMDIDYHGVHLHLKSEISAVSNADHNPIRMPELNNNPIISVSEETADISDVDFKEITAPLVGVFYLAPSPEEEPFVKVGQRVKKGDVVGIIEAMKCMNEIEAQEEGVVERIVAENASMVEYGQTLIVLKPLGDENV